MPVELRRALFAAIALIGLATACSVAMAAPPKTEPAPTETWERIGYCVEPDVFNRSGEPVVFVVQAVIGDGEVVSEVVTTERLEADQRAHLHLFADHWERPTGPSELVRREDAVGCSFRVDRVLD